MKRSLNDIEPVLTSHNVGLKRVLLAANESDCSLTQIAVTDLHAGEIVQVHIHPDMQEGLYVMSGHLCVILDGELINCSTDDFIYINKYTSHELRAESDTRILTIGCVINSQYHKLYPMLFEPNLHEMIWGGCNLSRWKKMTIRDNIGESWEVSDVDSSPSFISNGIWAGSSLTEIIAKMPEAILGREVVRQYGGHLPLLVKFIDACGDLSIQVHPDDLMAQNKHGKMGKTEMWYVIDAAPGAYIYSGFKDEITPEEYKRRVQDGTITDVLARHEVHVGDVFYIPAGRVHAICHGVLLAEVQQSSDVTYRIYDYGRVGLDGHPRELHTDLALEALNYHVEDDYRTDYPKEENRANRVIESPFFSVRITEIDSRFHRNLIKYDSFIIAMCLKGDCYLKIRSTQEEILLKEGFSTLIPAVIADYDIIPKDAKCKVLEAFIDNMNKKLIHRVTRFLHISSN